MSVYTRLKLIFLYRFVCGLKLSCLGHLSLGIARTYIRIDLCLNCYQYYLCKLFFDGLDLIRFLLCCFSNTITSLHRSQQSPYVYTLLMAFILFVGSKGGNTPLFCLYGTLQKPCHQWLFRVVFFQYSLLTSKYCPPCLEHGFNNHL